MIYNILPRYLSTIDHLYQTYMPKDLVEDTIGYPLKLSQSVLD